MVVRLPQSEELFPRGRIVVGNGYDETIRHVNRKPVGDWLVQRNKSVQTLDEFDLQNELWEKRFNRWWGWNWLRRRKENLQKFGIKSCAKEQFRSMQKALKIRNAGSIPAYLKQYYNTPCNSSENCNKKLHRIITSHKPVNSRIKRRNNPELEPWLLEHSSNSDLNQRFVRMVPKSTQKRSAKENVNYLDKRLRKMDFEIENNKQDLKFKLLTSRDELVENVLKKSSPVSPDISGLLKPISITDKRYIPMPRFKYLEKFEFIQKEHQKLSNEINIESLKPFYSNNNNIPMLHINSNSNIHIKNNLKQINTFPKRNFNDILSNNFAIERHITSEINYKNSNYDINYISNNILAFSSQISDINFLYYILKDVA